MTLELPSRQSFMTSKKHEYSYIYIPPTTQQKTLLFLHGFPSQIHDWTHQIHHFSSLGYGIVACDLLGYGETDKPTDFDSYRLKPMGDEVAELLDSLSVSKVVGIGHDVGSTLLSRLAVYHPNRWTALVFLAVGPPKLGTPFEVDLINRMTKEAMGFEMLGYIPWIGGQGDAQQTLENNAEAAMSLVFAADRASWNEWFHPLGRMKQFVSNDMRVPIGPWYSEDLQRKHLYAFGKRGGYTGATRWYQMWLKNRFAPDEVGYECVEITQASLFVGPKEPAAAAKQQHQMLSAWTPNLTTVYVDSGHWVHLERAAETNKAIEEFLCEL